MMLLLIRKRDILNKNITAIKNDYKNPGGILILTRNEVGRSRNVLWIIYAASACPGFIKDRPASFKGVQNAKPYEFSAERFFVCRGRSPCCGPWHHPSLCCAQIPWSHVRRQCLACKGLAGTIAVTAQMVYTKRQLHPNEQYVWIC